MAEISRLSLQPEKQLKYKIVTKKIIHEIYSLITHHYMGGIRWNGNHRKTEFFLQLMSTLWFVFSKNKKD